MDNEMSKERNKGKESCLKCLVFECVSELIFNNNYCNNCKNNPKIKEVK